ncbi:MAG: cbb3-type cytochrome c oxidase subunit 3 [Alcaligenaceae bacterium]|jgi:cytochrome c oxidase cbb3-type subunit 4|nr:cbb3-type cytochrome c oxidase subunit 3 [Alcaligenaceae bacterium]
MWGTLNGIATLLAIIVFFGIVWWAFSKNRRKDNEEAALLPFSLEDETNLSADDEREDKDHE